MKLLKFALLVLLTATGLIYMAAAFPPGYVGGNVYYGEIYVDNGGDDELLIPNNATLQFGSLANSSTGHVSTGAVWLSYSDKTNDTANISKAVYTDAGGTPSLDDCTSGGNYTATTAKTYIVKIDGEGTGAGSVDTFTWSDDNGSTWETTGVPISGRVFQQLSNGLVIKFDARTGHDTDDYWTITCSAVTGSQAWPTIATPTSGTIVLFDYIDVGQSADIPAGVKSIKLITSGAERAYVRFRLIY